MGYWESDPLIYAVDAGGSLVHVDSVANGSACACVCPSCRQPLVAKNAGSMLVHHFAHKRGACKWAAEAAVVLLTRDVLIDERRMSVAGAGYTDPSDCRWRYYSPCGLLDVREVSLLEVEGRQAPALRVKCIDECPLLGQADVVADCGGYAWSPDRCIFFEGQRRYLIGCTARQNGIGVDGE